MTHTLFVRIRLMVLLGGNRDVVRCRLRPSRELSC